MQRLNSGGEIYLTHTKLNGKFTLRLCVGQAQTEKRHVENAWRLIKDTAKSIR
jgi:aromatic-L-amino-acid decarboxylase